MLSSQPCLAKSGYPTNQHLSRTFYWAGYMRTVQALALHTLAALNSADWKTG